MGAQGEAARVARRTRGAIVIGWAVTSTIGCSGDEAANGDGAGTGATAGTAGVNAEIGGSAVGGTAAGGRATGGLPTGGTTGIGGSAGAGETGSPIAAGVSHTCAVVNGGVQCWGDDSSGQLGNNSTTGSNVPVQVQFP
jgi:hypothetical protein